MKVYFHARFKKKFKKLPAAVRQKFFERLRLLRQDPFHPQLNNHPLQGQFQGYRSINVTGDFRAVFIHLGPDSVEFQTIGTHSELCS